MGQLASTFVIKLTKELNKARDFFSRSGSIPDAFELDQLNFSVVSSMAVSATRGASILTTDPSNSIMIAEGYLLENEVVAGSLYVISHCEAYFSDLDYAT